MEDQSSEANTRSMNPKLIVVFTPRGMECHSINADTEEEETLMQRLLGQISPCLDIADAILKRGDLGATG